MTQRIKVVVRPKPLAKDCKFFYNQSLRHMPALTISTVRSPWPSQVKKITIFSHAIILLEHSHFRKYFHQMHLSKKFMNNVDFLSYKTCWKVTMEQFLLMVRQVAEKLTPLWEANNTWSARLTLRKKI